MYFNFIALEGKGIQGHVFPFFSPELKMTLLPGGGRGEGKMRTYRQL